MLLRSNLACFVLSIAGLLLMTRPAKSQESQATPVEAIRAPQDFVVELLYSVPKEQEGSWVSIATDPTGRLIACDQYGSLYRVTVGETPEDTQVEQWDLPIGEAQGLLWAYDSLYVVVNGKAAEGSGLYRVVDTDDDGELDEVRLLKRLKGGGEHGPHAVRLGPDGMLYVIAGNHTQPPEGLAPDSPHREWAEDLLLPRNPDGNGHATGRMAPAGWVARTDPEGKEWTFICSGFRNPYDFDFNPHGEIFVFDADMEWDTGTPWYRPTRVNHAISGAEFGWRFGTGKWPDYFPDSMGSVVDIGLGSPTGVAFGTGAAFPAKYQHAFYLCDWTYGKIYAVHLEPNGASYTGTFEVFIKGKPLPVTDILVHPDGALYFTIGGRRTQSGLYRVRYEGSESTEPAPLPKNSEAAAARKLRRKLESFHGRQDPAAVATAWPYLNSTDRALRYAARIAIEHQARDKWQVRAWNEKRTTAVIEAMVALAHAGEQDEQALIVRRLSELDFAQLSEEQRLAWLRAFALAFIRQVPDPEARAVATEKLNPLFPVESQFVNRELCRLLIYLEAPGIVERAMEQLKAALTQEEQLFYAFLLRNAQGGWTPDLRQEYFSWLNLAENKYRGGNSFAKFIQQIRADAVEKLDDEQRETLEDVLAGDQTIPVVDVQTTRQFIHNWQMSDLLPLLDEVSEGRSFEQGKLAYHAAQCQKCHRFANEGGSTGPDLTGAGNRFSPRDLLESILSPSRVISDQYKGSVVVTKDGNVWTGRVINHDEDKLVLRTDPYTTHVTEVAASNVESVQPSTISEMPEGLVNVLTTEEILDLIAYVRSGGKPDDAAFQKAH